MSVPLLDCSKHTRKAVTNYCYSEGCLKPLCPECIESHIKLHSTKSTLPEIQTFQSAAARCTKKLKFILESLSTQTKHTGKKELGVEAEIEKMRKRLHQAVDKSMNSLVKSLPSESQHSSKVADLTKDVQLLLNHLQNQSSCVQAIRKSFLLNLDSIWQSLEKSKQRKVDLSGHVALVAQIEDNIMKLGHQELKVVPTLRKTQPLEKEQQKKNGSGQLVIKGMAEQKTMHFTCYPDKLFILHLPNTRLFQYRPKVQVPWFSRSVLVGRDDWAVYLIGGGNLHSGKKLGQVYKITETSSQLIGTLREARSSFAAARVSNSIFVVGGYGQGNQVLSSLQCINLESEAITTMARCRQGCINALLVPLGSNQLLKVGGSEGTFRMTNLIEVYNILQNKWSIVDPVLDKPSKVQIFCSMGGVQINQTQVFLFGGYDEERDSQPKRDSFVLTYNPAKKDYSIECYNQFLLPFQQGFWGESVIFGGKVWALQNVADVQGVDCQLIPDRRRIINFDGKTWAQLK